jgi:hypothetical protein
VNKYLLSFSQSSLSPNPSQIQIFVSQNRDIESWYMPFMGTYILKSPRGLHQLNAQFAQLFGGNMYLLTYADSSFATGSLPEGIWKWFNDEVNPFIPPPPSRGD